MSYFVSSNFCGNGNMAMGESCKYVCDFLGYKTLWSSDFSYFCELHHSFVEIIVTHTNTSVEGK